MNIRKFYIVLIVVLININLLGCEGEDLGIELSTEAENATHAVTIQTSKIYVHISGSVKKPGVYSIDEGGRLYQIIEMAGGLTKNAKESLLNLAEVVTDGQKIHIMSKKEYKSKESATGEYDASDASAVDDTSGLININHASEEELMKLPGIGASKAAAIIKFRDDNGDFASIDDIKNVSGIGDATFSNIESMITVS